MPADTQRRRRARLLRACCLQSRTVFENVFVVATTRARLRARDARLPGSPDGRQEISPLACQSPALISSRRRLVSPPPLAPVLNTTRRAGQTQLAWISCAVRGCSGFPLLCHHSMVSLVSCSGGAVHLCGARTRS